MIELILGSKVLSIGSYKTNMSVEKTNLGNLNVVSIKEATEKNKTEPVFSKGLYQWVMFVISLYTRVRENLKIDFESFIILQVVVSHSLYEVNKLGIKTFSELEDEMVDILHKKQNKTTKLTFASISEVLQLPRETVRRKVLELCKKDILIFESQTGIKLSKGYKKIYGSFVSQTTNDLSSLINKWDKSGALKLLLEMKNK